jgi:hypothetical protein
MTVADASGSCGRESVPMTEAEWLACHDPNRMLEFLRGKVSDRKLRLFAVACCMTVWDLLPDEITREAVRLALRAAEGQSEPAERHRLAQAIHPALNTRYGVFLCGGCQGSGATYAAMAATAALDDNFTFTWYMGPNPSETHSVWDCVASARAQTVKERVWAERWQEWEPSGDEAEEEPDDAWQEQTQDAGYAAEEEEQKAAQADHARLLRDITGPSIRGEILFPPAWRTPTALSLADAFYNDGRAIFLSILADALEDAGCTDAAILDHCRGPGPHVRGCWVVDLLLGK